VNTLCGKKVLQGKDADDATNAHLEEGVRIKPITVGAFSTSIYKSNDLP
jgi:cell division control protein 11